MKIILCGKGGSGKSTAAALLAGAYVKHGYKVLVIDSDESNFGLHRQLGLPLPKDFTLFFGHKKGIFEDGAEKAFRDGWHLSDIPEEYSATDGNVILMSIGKIKAAGEGCACPMGALAKTFLSHLVLGEKEIAIIDTEAGVEHFGRGVDRFADAILMVADPSYESIQLAGKISDMGKSFGKPVYIILNKVNEEQKTMMETAIGETANIIAAIPSSSEILMKGLRGEKLDVEMPEMESIFRILG